MLIRVAVPVPQLGLLIYEVPEDFVTPPVGSRVVVPVGSRTVTGVVVDHATSEQLTSGTVKPIRQLLDDRPLVPPDVIELALWTAEYYAAGPGETVTAVLPPKTRGSRADAHKTERFASVTAAGLQALEAEAALSLTIKQRSTLELLSGTATGLQTTELAARGFSADTLKRLAGQGLVSLRREPVGRDPFVGQSLEVSPETDRRLTLEQDAAFDRLTTLAARRQFHVALLHGVTGSGKTEIYLRLAGTIRAAGRTSLMLVPEIALTPAVASLLRQAFGERVAIQHSGLSDGERHDQWHRIRRGEVDVVVGTRSAVFAPLAEIGLIVVDEEHDASYKQEESPRYNARDVAIVRGQRAGALVVLGSATPSMESYRNAMSGKYDRIVLGRRVLDRPLATMTVVDMREEYAAAGPDVILSRALTAAIEERLERQEQAIVLLNRRGLATAVFCRQCAGTLDCPNCSVSLVVHTEGAAGRPRARCHYCNYSVRVPTKCLLCAGPYLEQAGFGTERVESEVRRLHPKARVARLDRDSMRRRGALTDLLARFRTGAVDVLVGTQMIAKGHDFPRVTLVGVVSADVGLGLADFRASERTFQLLTQVAGRAGRGEHAGEAIVQTLYPAHHSVQLACRQDYAAFYERELHFRRSMRYPPLVALVNVVVRARTFGGAMDNASDIAQRLRQSECAADFLLLGPAPAPLGRLRGEYRAQLLLKGTSRKRMREALRSVLAERPDLARRTIVDVDPVSVL
ncbi:MAG TPA: primosomal protein N' [Vicinamibacterales bacterium]|nr:primosomal protein N' [Vicinamibacterales bacterium]